MGACESLVPSIIYVCTQEGGFDNVVTDSPADSFIRVSKLQTAKLYSHTLWLKIVGVRACSSWLRVCCMQLEELESMNTELEDNNTRLEAAVLQSNSQHDEAMAQVMRFPALTAGP